MKISLPSLQHLATGVVTLPVKVAARAVGMARGTVSAARGASSDAPSWDSVDRVAAPTPPAPPVPSPSLGTEPTPVNVTEELGLDPAPVPAPEVSAPRTPPVTSIDEQAEPGLVDSTPADVAERIARRD